MVREYGGGAENRFDPLAFNAAELDKAVDAIANAAARKQAPLEAATRSAAYKQPLQDRRKLPQHEWEKFRAQGKIPARQLAVGTQLHSNHFSYQYITKIQSGYIRTFDNGRIERFNEDGKLQQHCG